jgi:NAD+ synthase
VLGLSGGIDSALSAVVAVDALGAERVLGVRLPSPFTGQVSMEEAQFCRRPLGIRLLSLPIGGVMASAEETLAPVFEGRARDVAEENLQARIRGLLLMGLSNKFGYMLPDDRQQVGDVGWLRDPCTATCAAGSRC